MADLDRFDDDDLPRRSDEPSDDDLKKFRESIKNGSRDINNPEALEEIIQFYFEHEEFDEALRFAERLISFQPFNSDAWQQKGMILNNLFKYEDALECYEKALSLNPTDSEIFINRGITLDNLNRVEDSLASFEKALELDPLNEEALFHKGLTLEKEEKIEDAVQTFRKIL